MDNNTPKNPNELEEFWNNRAESFPRYNQEENSYENTMLETAKKLGAIFKGQRVLDVGCGSGMYTLKLSALAQSVVGVDISEKMLAISREDAQKLGYQNITYVRSNWDDYQPEGEFGVAFCSMCPPMKRDEAKAKLLNITGSGTLVYIGFDRYINPEPIEFLIHHYKLEKKTFNSGPDMRRWLDQGGHNYRWENKTGHWTNRYNREQAFKWCRTLLSDFGIDNPESSIIDASLAPFWAQASEQYVITTPYSVEMIVVVPSSQ
ncbi:MAG: methyltransferase domain-containing protein [Deltaproteobacteria bacterium]|jgi:SAM-dependent methyltransferase|nr:methyltransferase domain-containing protein [Deltaproteobacteria bacterium]